MKSIVCIMRSSIVLIMLLLLQAPSAIAAPTGISVVYSSLVSAATMTSYCQAPPLRQPISPNIMLGIDVSGSMTQSAYTGTYDSSKQYEGYFDPEKYYAFVYSDGTNTSFVYSAGSTTVYYEEEPHSGDACVKTTCDAWKKPCPGNNTGGCFASGTPEHTASGCANNKFACCTSWNTTGDCGNPKSGNQLNFENMRRIDLLRWAMTGGTPATNDSTKYCGDTNKKDGKSCNPQRWDDASSDMAQYCSPTKGCILSFNPLADTDSYKYKVRVPWERVMEGLAFKLQKLPVVPRMGSLFFHKTGVHADGQTYIGDFTAAASKSSYVFDQLIAAVNFIKPEGSTPTGPVMWDILNYYAQKEPQFSGTGGLKPQATTSSADTWKNPMYDCPDQGGSHCIFIPCVDNFAILMSDGAWNTPSKLISTPTATGAINYADADPVVPAYVMHHDFLNTKSSVTTRVRDVYTISLFQKNDIALPSGPLALQNVALYGAYPTASFTWPAGTAGFPQADCGDVFDPSKGSPCTAIPASHASWDSDSDGSPDTYATGDSASEIRDSIYAAILEILSRTTAGTAASVLASREGSGANLLQAVYYPKKSFINDTVDWVGNLQNLWYYIDPAFANSTIREDGPSPGDKILTLKTDATHKDYITQFYYDTNLQAAMAKRWTDDNGDASIVGETPLSEIKVDAVGNIWEAGELLWERSWLNRKIFTTDVSGATSTNLMDFKCTAAGNCPNKSTLRRYLNAATDDEASTIMEWVIGNDNPTSGAFVPSYRLRSAQVGTVTHIWKLGDIINSTPKISSWQPLGDYHLTYNKYETTYGPQGSSVYQSDPVNTAYYTTGYRYKGRGMVYAGGNDGMLHAFRLGLLQTKWSGQGTYEKAKLTKTVCSSTKSIYCSSDSQCPGTETCTSTVTLGEEVWAFIPKHVLPYLKYLADPSYCHLYTVDLTPTVFDASIAVPTGCTEANYYDCQKTVESWRTILIGGMRLGGGCRKPTIDCTSAGTACISTPRTDPADANRGLGYSSYFALDITDQDNPKLMWEYDGTEPPNFINRLGLSYSGPAVLRVSNFSVGSVAQAAQNNGRWLVVFGTGPTGPIDTSKQQFVGLSDRNLYLHVFDLAKGPGTDNDDVTFIDTGISNAFSGSITTTTFDIDLDYSDDVLYIPYTTATSTASYNGGLGRLVTKGEIDPSDWEWSKVIINTGPITAAPDMLIDPDTDDLWIYFGTGRYFYDTIAGVDDADPAKRRQIFGMKEQCLNATKDGFLSKVDCSKVIVDFDCATPSTVATCGGLTNVDDIAVADNLEATKASSTDPNYKGWYIDLDPAITATTPNYYGERIITNPSVDATGIVFFTSFKPQNNACQKDGQTNIWAVKFDTGGAATGLIKGTAIIQVSTGSIEQINLATAFTERDDRRTAGMTGQPPTREGLTVIPGAPGMSKPLFMKER